MKASDKKIKREEPLSVELMIATVSQNDDSVLDRMHVQSDAVVINQGSPFQWILCYKCNGRNSDRTTTLFASSAARSWASA